MLGSDVHFPSIIPQEGLGSADIEYIRFGSDFIPVDRTVDIVKTLDDDATPVQNAGATPKTAEWTNNENGIEIATPVDIRHTAKELEVFIIVNNGSGVTSELWATASADTQVGGDTLLFTFNANAVQITPNRRIILPANKFLTLKRTTGSPQNASFVKVITIERG